MSLFYFQFFSTCDIEFSSPEPSLTYKNFSNFFGYVILKDILNLKFWYSVVFYFVKFKILCSFQKNFQLRLSRVIFLV